MWRQPFLTFYLAVGPSSPCCNLVLGRFLAHKGFLWCTSDYAWDLVLGVVPPSELWMLVYLDLPGLSTLGIFCASLTDYGAASSTGADVGVAHLKMLERTLGAVV